MCVCVYIQYIIYQIHYNPILLRQLLLTFFLTNPRTVGVSDKYRESRRFRLDLSQVATACSAAVSFARRNELSLRARRERPTTPLLPFPWFRRGKARGGCGRHSTVTKGNHHRSGGTGTSSGHKLSKSRRYFAESSAKRTILLVRWKVNKSVREVRYKLH